MPYVDLTDLDENIVKLDAECNKFKKDKMAYLKELLNLGINHPLNQIKEFTLSEKLSTQDIAKLLKRCFSKTYRLI